MVDWDGGMRAALRVEEILETIDEGRSWEARSENPTGPVVRIEPFNRSGDPSDWSAPITIGGVEVGYLGRETEAENVATRGGNSNYRRTVSGYRVVLWDLDEEPVFKSRAEARDFIVSKGEGIDMVKARERAARRRSNPTAARPKRVRVWVKGAAIIGPVRMSKPRPYSDGRPGDSFPYALVRLSLEDGTTIDVERNISPTGRPNAPAFVLKDAASAGAQSAELEEATQAAKRKSNPARHATNRLPSAGPWYAGHQKFEKLSSEHVGSGNDQLGPGFYFTSSRKTARGYGPVIVTATIAWKKTIDPYATIPPTLLDALLALPAPQWEEENDTNWGLRDGAAARNQLRSTWSRFTLAEVLSQLPGTLLWYGRRPSRMLDVLTAQGYTGFVVGAGSTHREAYAGRDGETWAVVWDLDAIAVKEIQS